MAIIHRATITPTKLELLDQWQGEDIAGSEELHQVGSYRFDDPSGDVGVEALLVGRGGPVRHVVLTYRASARNGADEDLVGTLEHSVLGTRWVYDGRADPVARAAYARALAGQQEQAALEVWDDGVLVETRAPTVELTVRDVAVSAGGLTVHLAPEIGPVPEGGPALVARWDGGEGVVAWAPRQA